MWKVATGVVLALVAVSGMLFYQNRGLSEDLQESEETIKDLRYDLQSWELAGQFWERQNRLQQKITLQREQRNQKLTAENQTLKTKLRGITDVQDPCLKAPASDDVLSVLWDEDAKAAAQLPGANGYLDSANTGTTPTETR